jgi:nucleotide-binding universal stress UspA family protein
MSGWLAPLCPEGVTVDCEVIPGMPVEALDDLAQGRGCDLLMITATGKGALERFFLGSTAEGLARKAQTPLWIVRNGEAGRSRRVVVGVDHNPTSREALHMALVQANRDEAALDVIHTWRDPGSDTAFTLASPEDQARYRSQELRREQERFSKMCLEVLPREMVHGPAPAAHLLAGKPASVLVKFADEHHADLLVVGRRDHNLLHDLILGSTAERVLRSAHCDVLVVRPPDQAEG